MIYVDSPKFYPSTRLRYKTWSHLWSDTSLEELHVMAEKLDLRRKWFQAGKGNRLELNHYDVIPSKRQLALRLGATAMEFKDYLLSKMEAEAVS